MTAPTLAFFTRLLDDAPRGRALPPRDRPDPPRRAVRRRPRVGRAAPLPRRRGRAAVAVRLPRARGGRHERDPARHRRRHPAARRPGARRRGRRRARPALRRAHRPRPRQRRHAVVVRPVRPATSTTKARVYDEKLSRADRGARAVDEIGGGQHAATRMPGPSADRVWQATFSADGRHARRRARPRPAALAHAAAPGRRAARDARGDPGPDHRRLPRRRCPVGRGAADHGIPHGVRRRRPREALRFAEVGLRRAAEGFRRAGPDDPRRHARRAHRRRSTRTSARPRRWPSRSPPTPPSPARPRSRSRCTPSTPRTISCCVRSSSFATEVAPALGWATQRPHARSTTPPPFAERKSHDRHHDDRRRRRTRRTSPRAGALDTLRRRRPVTRAQLQASTTPSSSRSMTPRSPSRSGSWSPRSRRA